MSTDPTAEVLRSFDDAHPVDAAGLLTYEPAVGFLDALTRRWDVVDALLQALCTGGPLRRDCESFPHLDKLVLWEHPERRVKLRLHVFSSGYGDLPHNHRWPFAARILHGAYVHSIYGDEATVLAADAGGRQLTPLLRREETRGNSYLIDHSLVHSLRAEATVVSLVLRGEPVKSSYFTFTADGLVWSSGRERESTTDQALKVMSDERLDRTVETLRALPGL